MSVAAKRGASPSDGIADRLAAVWDDVDSVSGTVDSVADKPPRLAGTAVKRTVAATIRAAFAGALVARMATAGTALAALAGGALISRHRRMRA